MIARTKGGDGCQTSVATRRVGQSRGVRPVRRLLPVLVLALGWLAAWTTGCERKPASTDAERLAGVIVGTWRPPEQDGESMTFAADGTWTGQPDAGTGPTSGGQWRIDGGKLIVTWRKIRNQDVPADQRPIEYEIVSVEPRSLYLRAPNSDPAEWRKLK